MKTILLVLLDRWADWEGAYLASALGMLAPGKYAVKTVSLTGEPVSSIGGVRALPDFSVDGAPEEYEALFLIGGLSWREESARRVTPLVKDCLAKGRVLGGICDAAGFLGTVGALNQVRHTANDLGDLKRWAGDAYTGEERYLTRQAVRDQNIVTANGTAALEFAKEALLALDAAPEPLIQEWFAFHKLGYYNAPLSTMS
ncbi:DJ-1/PfpI family protein [Bittarella massiliensis]|uniref:DJ-1/PfpI family protein n=1 Tax=Bittarella (ex Durand et al. 2017) TaxID=1929297 RepID=UPI00163D0120|nr:DJ-1/PfpI family protein [Bittarella massiliensis (ex Durand et al. 2017)]